MPDKDLLKHRRRNLLILLGPGILALLLTILAGPPQPRNPGISSLRWQTVAPVVAVVLLAGGALLHWKAVSDFVAGHRSYWKTVLFITTAIAGGVAIPLMAAEWAAGRYLAATSQRTVPIFPPYAKVSFRTSEYTYTAEANSMGFRDRETGPKSGFRIIALGDSFTYGWGVELADSWPKVLERLCREHGGRVEVLNLGCPGASVDVYAEVAERGIPLLKPDLVLVGVLQGEDLKQLDMGGTMERLAGPRWALATVLARVIRPRPSTPSQVKDEWQRGVQMIQARLAPEERMRLEQLDPEVKAMFLAGDLSPHLLRDTLKHPDFLEFTLDPSQPEIQKASATMTRCLQKIRQAADRQGARVIVLSVPWAYVSARAVAAKRRLGFRAEDSVVRSDAPDEAIRANCRTAGVEFHCFTERFREECKRRNLFFEFDGHLNAEGYALYGEEVCKLLLEQKLLPMDGSAAVANAPASDK